MYQIQLLKEWRNRKPRTIFIVDNELGRLLCKKGTARVVFTDDKTYAPKIAKPVVAAKKKISKTKK